MEFFIALLNCDTWWQLQHNILGSLTRSQVGRRRPCFPHLLLFRGSWVSLDRKRKAFRCFPYPLQSFPGNWKWLQLSTKLETFLISGMNFQFSGPHLTAWPANSLALLYYLFSPQILLQPSGLSSSVSFSCPTNRALWGQASACAFILTLTHSNSEEMRSISQSLEVPSAGCWQCNIKINVWK